MEKSINMQDIMEGLGIKVDDMVLVNKQVLICNDEYDLVKPDGLYCGRIPNLILGMVSGKYDYKIYVLKDDTIIKEIYANGEMVVKKTIPPVE